MATWKALAGVLDWEVDFKRAAQTPPGVPAKIETARIAFVATRDPWQAAEVRLRDETGMAARAWVGDLWVSLDPDKGRTGSTTNDGCLSDFGLVDLLLPRWYEPTWGPEKLLARAVMVSDRERFALIGEAGMFFAYPGIEIARVTYNPQLGIVDSIVSLDHDEEIASLHVDVFRLA